LKFLFLAFNSFVDPLGGTVFFSGVRLRIREQAYREPDLLLLKDKNDPRKQERFWSGTDLTLEVVSEDNPARDLVEKRKDYAEARVPEYWIVNSEDETITVLKLDGASYVEHGVFVRGDAAASAMLPGFTVSVAAVFDAK
jgi:Uma2 family endonuclease